MCDGLAGQEFSDCWGLLMTYARDNGRASGFDALLVGPVICLGNTNHGTGLVGGDHPEVFGPEAATYASSAYLAGEARDPGY